MAGGHGGFQPVKIDPAIERWNAMRENVYKTFRFTSKTSRQVVVFGAVVPALIGAACYFNDANQDWAGKRRGESLMVSSPAQTKQE
ncbi:hypothetical protein NliqN6_6479 [Naganishia liquefaciens]|uniref:NADH dehydrogenase [ubiquinone] 1 beta subcomplex subunit 4 n=1 Tax=Naganishia liquefaciens TaxID=104408 RepID=A0A8H3TZR8_9TREE|nr:hypothetical protein NliqN6_6479 [Naganishia liquefaciens]